MYCYEFCSCLYIGETSSSFNSLGIPLRGDPGRSHVEVDARVGGMLDLQEDFIRRFGAKATKASQAQSRQKQLDKLRAEQARCRRTNNSTGWRRCRGFWWISSCLCFTDCRFRYFWFVVESPFQTCFVVLLCFVMIGGSGYRNQQAKCVQLRVGAQSIL